MPFARGTMAVLVTAFSIRYADRTWQQAIGNLEALHQEMLPLPQARGLRSFDLGPVGRLKRQLHLSVILLSDNASRHLYSELRK